MPYTKVNWEDYPSTATPLNAANLDKMDSGIKDLDDVYESLKDTANNGKLVYVNEGALDTLPPSNLDLHVGSPTVVSSLDEMTDTSKIYVYDNDWYSYDGTEWVDRGPFNEPEIVTDKTLSVTNRPADGKAVGDALASLNQKAEDLALDLEKTKAPAIFETLSGDLISFTDEVGNLPLESLVINVDSVQSGEGDPSPTNIRPISGWTGCKVTRTAKNLFGGTLLRDGAKTNMPNSTVDDTAKTVTFYSATTVVGGGGITGPYGLSGKFKENTAYTIILTYTNTSSSVTSSNLRVRYTDGTNEEIPRLPTPQTKETVVVTTNPSKTVNFIYKSNFGGTTVLYYEESGIFEGTLTADDFVPYVGQTYDITFPSEAGTVYGGVLDVANGTLKVDKANIIYDGTNATWTVSQQTSGVYRAQTFIGDMKSVTSRLVIMADSATPDISDESEGHIRNYQTRIWWYPPASITTVEGLNAYLAEHNLQVVYELATPVTITLDPTTIRTLLGLNNIWADCGDVVTCKYPLDTKTYIDKENAEIDQEIERVDTIKAPMIYESASGSLVTLNDGADSMPIKSMTVDVEAVQAGSGDPSPTNIRPISGWTGCKVYRTGKNLLNLSEYIKRSGYTKPDVTVSGDTVTLADGTSTARYVSFVVPVVIGEKYTVTADTSTIGSGGIWFEETKPNSYGRAGSTTDWTTAITVTATAPWMVIMLQGTSGTIKGLRCSIGESAEPYEAYVGNVYDITFPDSAGTVYGGTVDPVAGTLKVTEAFYTFDGSESEGWTAGSSTKYFSVVGKAPSADAGYISNYLTGYTGSSTTYLNYGRFKVDGNGRVTVGNSLSEGVQYADVAAFKAALAENPLQIGYKRLTPLTITLDPTTIRTLLGLNNIWVDTGAIEEVVYAADTKMYIENLTKPSEDDMVANSVIEAGTFFMIGNKLFLSTASIANGATITVGTNATELSLAEALNLLAIIHPSLSS